MNGGMGSVNGLKVKDQFRKKPRAVTSHLHRIEWAAGFTVPPGTAAGRQADRAGNHRFVGVDIEQVIHANSQGCALRQVVRRIEIGGDLSAETEDLRNRLTGG